MEDLRNYGYVWNFVQLFEHVCDAVKQYVVQNKQNAEGSHFLGHSVQAYSAIKSERPPPLCRGGRGNNGHF